MFSKDFYSILLRRSLSFTMVTTGLAFLFMAVVYILVDAKRWWSGAPFLYAGKFSNVIRAS